MDRVIRQALSSTDVFERFDHTSAQELFQRINEQWEEMYAELWPRGDAGIPRDFLDGRKAFIFHMFYRVVELHDQEVRKIETEGRWKIV
jgi:hypothetical protein